MKRTISLFLSVILLLTLGCSDDQPTESQSVTAKGTVIDKATQQPVSGAKVTIAGKETTTDAVGNYQLNDLPTGTHKVSTEKENYAAYIEEVSITSGENIFDLELETIIAYCTRVTSLTYKLKEYNTVLIGNQCWFKENLNYGTQINVDEVSANNPTVEKYCFRNSKGNCDEYGGLYKWEEAMNYIYEEGSQGICPESWHIPTFAEMEELKIEVGEDGNALKEIGQGEDAGAGTNTSGFSAMLGGYLISYPDEDAFFENVTNWTLLWTSTESGFEDAFVGDLNRSSSNFALGQRNRNWGISIRCIKD